MSTLDELLRKLCPDGVEYAKLGDVCIRQKGIPITAAQMKMLHASGAPIRIFAGGNTIADIKYSDINPQSIITRESIIVKSRGNIDFEYYNRPFSHKNELWSYSIASEQINLKFIYYYLQSNISYFEHIARTGKLPQISSLDTDKYNIPIPPLPVQAEIVRILDAFTELSDELMKKLADEATARRKQYEYYRDALIALIETKSEVTTLEECITSLNTGLNPRRFFKLNTDDAKNYYVTIRELRNNKICFSDKTDLINDEALAKCNRRSNLEVGDVLFSGTGTIGEVAIVKKKPVNWNIKEGIYAIKPRPDVISSKFLMYLLKTKTIRNSFMSKVAGGTVQSLPMKEMRSLKIPLPPLATQARIVSILDRFDALCNDLTSGLPAEIAARRKQYEYYRDRLLAFKEKTA